MPLPEDDRIGKEIAAAYQAPTPEQVAHIIVKNLFDRDGAKLAAHARYVAVTMIAGALGEWQKSLGAGQDGREVTKWKEAYQDIKAELDELQLFVAIKQKEGKLR